MIQSTENIRLKCDKNGRIDLLKATIDFKIAATNQGKPQPQYDELKTNVLSAVVCGYVTCCFKTFYHFETAMAVLIPLQGLEMTWPFGNRQIYHLAIWKRPTISLGCFDTSPV